MGLVSRNRARTIDMARRTVDWDNMFRALEAFKKEQGHCHVPVNWEKNAQLGRWVAMQRFRHKIGELQKYYVNRLDQIDFVWAPADKVWNEMFARLIKFKKKHGNCDVPSSYPSDPNLANWVANQRHRKKMGSLSAERVQKLTETGFVWSVYGRSQAEKVAEVKKKVSPQQTRVVEPVVEEHLYQVSGEYIQYNGQGARPAKLEKYIQLHDGEFPPCIILPRHPVVFRIGSSDSALTMVRKFAWPGKGAIPADVLEYLNENGALPPHSA